MDKPQLPKSVQNQLDKANEMLKERETPALPKQEVKPEPEVQVTKPAPTAPVTPEVSVDALKRKIGAIEGMLRKANERSVALEQQLAAKDQELQEVKTKVPEKVDLSKYFTAEQVEHFGEDHLSRFLTAQIDAAKKVLDERLTQFESQRIKPIEQKMHDTAKAKAASEWDEFYTAICSKVEGFEEINNSSEWKTWLREVDAVSGFTRQEMLDNLTRKRDVSRIVALAETFLQSQGAIPQPTSMRQVVPTGDSAGAMSRAITRDETLPPLKEFYKYSKMAKGGQGPYARMSGKDLKALEQRVLNNAGFR